MRVAKQYITDQGQQRREISISLIYLMRTDPLLHETPRLGDKRHPYALLPQLQRAELELQEKCFWLCSNSTDVGSRLMERGLYTDCGRPV